MSHTMKSQTSIQMSMLMFDLYVDDVLDALLGLAQCAEDADLLVDVHLDLLLGHPVVLVLQDFQRRLGVA